MKPTFRVKYQRNWNYYIFVTFVLLDFIYTKSDFHEYKRYGNI